MSMRSSVLWMAAVAAAVPAAAPAEKLCMKAQCRAERRLASELVLTRRAKSDFRGVCRDGRAVYDVEAGQERAVQMMAAAIDAAQPVRSRRLMISYPDAAHKPAGATIAGAHMSVVGDYEGGSFLVVEPEGGVTAEEIDTLLADESVAYVAPDYVVRAAGRWDAQATPSDPRLGELWGLDNSGASRAWPRVRDASSVVVAVIDTGVDHSHPDLAGNMWTGPGGVHGHDFYDEDTDPMDAENHGTHVAGTIAAVGDNGTGVVGVAWRTQIMAMRFLGPDGAGATSDAVRCIDWAVAHGAHVLCNSWAGPDNAPELAEAISRAQRQGVLFVAAAGNTAGSGNDNDRRPFYPAAFPQSNVISVGAIDSSDRRGSFSHFGRGSVDIGAPGVQILSTVRGGGYEAMSGTSMAAPHVAGAAALVWAATFDGPAQSTQQMETVRDLICGHARPVAGLAGFWGHAAPARVPGGVLDLSFLGAEPEPPPRRLVENRMLVDPERLR